MAWVLVSVLLCSIPGAFSQRQDIVAGAMIAQAADSFSTILDGAFVCLSCRQRIRCVHAPGPACMPLAADVADFSVQMHM